MSNPTTKITLAKPTTPESIHMLFETFLNKGDLGGIMSLYDSAAVLVEKNGTLHSGAEKIQAYLQGLLSTKPVIGVHHRSTIKAGDVAVLISDWEVSGTAPNGAPAKDNGKTYDVARRLADGTWRIVVDNPWAFQV